MIFTQDWFSNNIPHIEHLVGVLDKPSKILEIGCFEGRATCWFLQNVIPEDGTIVCIDPFTGSMEHENLDLSHLYDTFMSNVNEVKKPSQTVTVHRDYSLNSLAELIIKNETFDLIYIDGDHTAPAVLTDACMAWPLLKQGGVMLFDDYRWNPPLGYTEQQKPKLAIDSFLSVFTDKVKIIQIGYQLSLQKLCKSTF